MSAAIPHAVLLLHALLDVLPFPRGPKGLWYEMRTGSVECVDELEKGTSNGKRSKRGKRADVADEDEDMELDKLLEGIGKMEVKQMDRVSRVTVSPTRIHGHPVICDLLLRLKV